MEPIARWKDLCLDAEDPGLLARFWAAALSLEVASTNPPSLVGAAEHERIWANPVDRPRPDSPKQNRLHLDLYAASVADLEALGARVLGAHAEDTGLGWTTMADPEGGELCCFVRTEPPRRRLHGIGVDCVDPERLAAWWGTVLGREVTTPPDGDWWTVEHATPDDVLTLDFNAVPEPKVSHSRVHWDLVGDVDSLLATGATRLWETEGWTVLADPEGHEFCCFPPA